MPTATTTVTPTATPTAGKETEKRRKLNLLLQPSLNDDLNGATTIGKTTFSLTKPSMLA